MLLAVQYSWEMVEMLARFDPSLKLRSHSARAVRSTESGT